MTRASTHITLHGPPPTTDIKVYDGVAIVTLLHGNVEQVVSGKAARVVDELLSLAGRVAREVGRFGWEAADPGLRASVQRNAAALAARVTVEAVDESALLAAVQGDHVGEGVADDGS